MWVWTDVGRTSWAAIRRPQSPDLAQKGGAEACLECGIGVSSGLQKHSVGFTTSQLPDHRCRSLTVLIHSLQRAGAYGPLASALPHNLAGCGMLLRLDFSGLRWTFVWGAGNQEFPVLSLPPKVTSAFSRPLLSPFHLLRAPGMPPSLPILLSYLTSQPRVKVT